MEVNEMVERVALAMWRAREQRFPGFTRRLAPDDMDRQSGAWADMCAQARAAIAAMRPDIEAWRVSTYAEMADALDAALSPNGAKG